MIVHEWILEDPISILPFLAMYRRLHFPRLYIGRGPSCGTGTGLVIDAIPITAINHRHSFFPPKEATDHSPAIP